MSGRPAYVGQIEDEADSLTVLSTISTTGNSIAGDYATTETDNTTDNGMKAGTNESESDAESYSDTGGDTITSSGNTISP